MDVARCRNQMQRNHLLYIDTEGVSLLYVSPRMDDESTTHWSYTIGLWQQYAHPEVIIFGLGPNLSMTLLNTINRLIRDAGRRFDSGTSASDVLEGFACYFEEVPRDNYGDWLLGDRWFYGKDEYKVVQMIWPTPAHIYPWQAEADEELATDQPLLCALPKRVVS